MSKYNLWGIRLKNPQEKNGGAFSLRRSVGLSAAGILQTSYEKLGGFFQLVDVQSLVYPVYPRLIVERIDERSETENVVGQRIVKASVRRGYKRIRRHYYILKGFGDAFFDIGVSLAMYVRLG